MSADDRRPPSGATPQSSPPPTRLYYRHQGTVVTNRHFVVGRYRYDITDLADLMRSRGSRHPGAIAGAVIAVAEAILLIPLVGVTQTPIVLSLAVAALAIPCLVGLVCSRRWPPQNELLARYRGREIVLFGSRDEREFGQVARAVQRALEDSPLELLDW